MTLILKRGMALVRSYVGGNLSPSIRTLSLPEFRRVAEALEGETFTVTASDIIRVLRQYAEEQIAQADLYDWILVLSWGNHPQAIERRSRVQDGGATYVYKSVADERGIKQLDIEFDERCHDRIVETIQDIEDRCEAPSPLTRPEADVYIGRLSGCE